MQIEIIVMRVVLKLLMIEKISNLRKIAPVHYNFIEIKKDIQLCIDYDPSCKDFWMYHYRRTVKRGFRMTIYFQWEYLSS